MSERKKESITSKYEFLPYALFLYLSTRQKEALNLLRIPYYLATCEYLVYQVHSQIYFLFFLIMKTNIVSSVLILVVLLLKR
jgi:hypothetical protein